MADNKNSKDINDNESQSSGKSDRDDEFESQSGAEDFEDYKTEGYHPVELGEVFNSKYQVVQKLGWGHFSTVWLVNEKKTPNYYALKIQKSKKSYSEAAVDELEILKALVQNTNRPEWQETIEELNKKYTLTLHPTDTFNIVLNDNFCHFGMHGKHYCSAFEIMGPNLLDIIQFFEYQDKAMDIRLVKIITRQILMGLDYMHRICKVIHTDLKPENIMLEIRGKELEQLIEDLKEYKKKPLSMKFLKKLQTSSKNKKKQQKKKKKKQAKAAAAQGETTQEGQESGQTTEQAATQEAPKEAADDKEKTEATAITVNQFRLDQQPDSTEEEVKRNTEEAKQHHKEHAEKAAEEKAVPEANDNSQTGQGEPEEFKTSDNATGEWSYTLKWKDHINVKLDKDVRIKIVDFGNGCWVNKHFTDNIQTREYRSPEAILGSNYKENTDIWSLACVVFEMLTSNFLFKPKKGDTYSKNDDHLALMIEHLGKMPKVFALKGKYSRDFFNKNGQLLKIKEKDLRETSIYEALIEDKQISEEDAKQVEKFLLPMLEYDPDKRISAYDALQSEWLWT